MNKIELARKVVIQAWLDGGFCPVMYAEAIAGVAGGKWDHQMPVKIALAALDQKDDEEHNEALNAAFDYTWGHD